MKLSNKGFTLIEGLLIVTTLSLVAGVGFYVVNANSDEKSKISSSQEVQQKSDSKKTDVLKEYKNQEYGFSFRYPESWTFREELKDEGRGQKEGTVAITSPAGIEVVFKPNLGAGKGGDCWDDQANAHTTRTCQTRTVYEVEKLSNSSDNNPVYFYKSSIKQPEWNGGAEKYYIYIDNGDFAPSSPSKTVGAMLNLFEVTTKLGGVGVSVSSKDTSTQDSKAYFDSNEVKEATPILKSFSLL